MQKQNPVFKTETASYTRAKCAVCSKPMSGIARPAADKRYCSPKCAVAGQPSKVIKGRGGASSV